MNYVIFMHLFWLKFVGHASRRTNALALLTSSSDQLWLPLLSTDEDSARDEARRHIQVSLQGYSNAEVVVKLGGWATDYSKTVAQASLSALKRLILSDKNLPGFLFSHYHVRFFTPLSILGSFVDSLQVG
jgi:hypothetical protein